MGLFYGCTFENCGGAAIKSEGDFVAIGRNNTVRNCESGVDVSSGGSALMSGFSFENNDNFGIRVQDGDFVGRNLAAHQNRIGIELRESSRGDFFDSDIRQNDDFDIRYDDDVLFGLYDTQFDRVHDLSRNRTNPDLGDDPLLNTTPEQLWRESKLSQAKSLSKEALLFGLGLQF